MKTKTKLSLPDQPKQKQSASADTKKKKATTPTETDVTPAPSQKPVTPPTVSAIPREPVVPAPASTPDPNQTRLFLAERTDILFTACFCANQRPRSIVYLSTSRR